MTDAYTQNYEQAFDLMKRRDVFDVTKEPARNWSATANTISVAIACLARRLVEHGVTYVQVMHTNYDTHNENFNFHMQQLGEFDGSFATLVTDLVERGMWGNTLVVVLSEFGRTPTINQFYGRDHWATAWSICLGGAKVHRGRGLWQNERQRHGRRRQAGRSREPVPHVSGRGRPRFGRLPSTSPAASCRWPTPPRSQSRNWWRKSAAESNLRATAT